MTDGAGAVAKTPEAGSMRASNAERDAVAGRLQDAFAEGRLDDTEFDERMRAALTATTHAELDRSGGAYQRLWEAQRSSS